jgi:hypothetical protein
VTTKVDIAGQGESTQSKQKRLDMTELEKKEPDKKEPDKKGLQKEELEKNVQDALETSPQDVQSGPTPRIEITTEESQRGKSGLPELRVHRRKNKLQTEDNTLLSLEDRCLLVFSGDHQALPGNTLRRTKSDRRSSASKPPQRDKKDLASEPILPDLWHNPWRDNGNGEGTLKGSTLAKVVPDSSSLSVPVTDSPDSKMLSRHSFSGFAAIEPNPWEEGADLHLCSRDSV